MSKIIETFGVIDKEEKVESLNENILEDTLVLDLSEPFPGYYGEEFLKKDKPEMVFLILNSACEHDKILRLTKKIKMSISNCFDGAPAEIFILNDKLNTIRIKFIESYDVIKNIQQYYIDEGLKFMKKKNIKANAFIRIYKIFRVEEILDDIYRDIDDANIYYLSIPCKLEWKDFIDITKKVRNNIYNISFDAAIGFFYYDTITDIIRIYSKKISVSELNLIKKQYCHEICKNF